MPRGAGQISLTEACGNSSDLSCDGLDFEVKMILKTSWIKVFEQQTQTKTQCKHLVLSAL